ncbi:MAG: Uma2 family endonuclease [Phycisphaerae bacterium]|nr:Uma2 family endonuclease [Gemmatimonadaceae bacterium]
MMTAEELLVYELPDKRTELVRGRLLVREPPGYRHGDVVVRLVLAIDRHLRAEQHALGAPELRGRLVAGDVGFTLQRNPDTVRAPDVSYIRLERCPPPDFAGYPEFAPDLAIEVRSPTDRTGNVLASVADLLNAGAQLVWVIDPKRRNAHVYRADGSISILAANESLLGEALLPGLTIPLSALLD